MLRAKRAPTDVPPTSDVPRKQAKAQVGVGVRPSLGLELVTLKALVGQPVSTFPTHSLGFQRGSP